MDLRRERSHIERKGFRYIQDTVGESVLWIEYDAFNSSSHNVYDEPTIGAGRAWKPPVLVPALWVNESEDSRSNSPEGRLPTNALRLGVTLTALTKAGISVPDDYRRHLNDVLFYRRNFWKVSDYQIRGRLRRSIIVGVAASQVKVDDDMPFDTLPDINGLLTTVRPAGFPSDGYVNQTFNEHELPAYHDGP